MSGIRVPATAAFRQYVPMPGHPRRDIDIDARGWADRIMSARGDDIRGIMAGLDEPFRGVTTNGSIRTGLFEPSDEGAPIDAACEAAARVLALASDEERRGILHPLYSIAWRSWMNPEAYVQRHGVRLEEISRQLREAVMAVLQASLSPSGYRKARDCMAVNAFLGDLVGMRGVMNEWSYNFTLFGVPSSMDPWGWQLHGHHLAINCMMIGNQMVATPCFWGAEPNEIDQGPLRGLTMFSREEADGLSLMQGLPASLRARAQLWQGVDDPALPPGRSVRGDQFVLAGAFQDNRVVPEEGISARDLSSAHRAALLSLAEVYHDHLPDAPRHARMAEIERHLDETRFCWIGGYDDESPFYYRIQSPVTLIEFDHHKGVFLTNEEPRKFHIHTVVRTPNGNDYGMAVVKQHCEELGHARHTHEPGNHL